MRSKFGASIDREIEPTAISKIRLLCHLRNQSDQPCRRFMNRKSAPRFTEEKIDYLRSIKHRALMWTRSYPQVLGYNSPPALSVESTNPIYVLHVGREFFPQCLNCVLRLEKRVQCSGELGAKVMINEQLQFASCCSKLTASRTAASGTS